ncbi:hypothetical protein JW916_14645 [Candidatus Sumerlaeota bacterium]|nr:hypothetical protein [Candidatus Sumerlaeota bacterium]
MLSISPQDDNARNPEPDEGGAPRPEGGATPSSMAVSSWPWLLGWLGVAVAVFSLGFVPLRVSHDEWWHLKTGKWIVEHGYRLPQKDIFTYTAASYDWDNHEWLSQIVMFLIYRAGEERVIGGWRAVILAKTLILIATYLLLGLFMFQRAGRGARGHAIAIFLMLVAAALGRRTFWPRPPVVSYFFMAFFLYVLWLHRVGRLRTPWLLVLPTVMVLWANLHGGFILGEVVVAAYMGGELIEWTIGRRFARLEPRDLRPFAQRAVAYLAVGLMCGVTSLLTPFGYNLYLLTHRVMKSKDLVARISELFPPDLRFTWAYVFLVALIAVGLFVSLVLSMRGAKKAWPPAADLPILAFFFWQSSRHVRHLPLFGIAAAPTAAWMLARLWGSDRARPGFRPLRTILVGLSVVMGSWLVFLPGEFLGVVEYLRRNRDEGGPRALAPSNFERNRALFRGVDVERGSYPNRAVDFVLSAQLPGRMFNENRMGGYLIWYMSPERYQVFTDQRFDIFGDAFLMDEISVVRGAPPGSRITPYNTPLPYWRDVLEKWNIDWMLFDRDPDVNHLLVEPDSGWALVFYDGAYVVWLKRTPHNRPWIAKYESRQATDALRAYLATRPMPRIDSELPPRE